MDRRTFLKSAGCGAAALMAAHKASGAGERRNVLLYVVDDQGTRDAGCYGRKNIRTPGLDTLAAAGTLFNHAYCTTASCSASRSVILTGLHNHANGQYGHTHSYHHFSSFDSIRSLPVLLGEAGYRTARIGKYHVAPEEVYQFDQALNGGSPEQMADNCRDLIASDSDDPFFLYFCTTEPHRPFRREGSDPVSPEEVEVPPYLPDIPACREELAQYYMSVQRADSGLQRLIEILNETGRWEDTLVIYISDNGIAFPGAKTGAYEPSLNLPCVIRNPLAEQRPAECNAMIDWTCITPTILDYANATPADYAFHGRSFLDAMTEQDPEGWDNTYASHTFHEITMYYPMRVVHERRFKLIWNIAHGLDYPFASDLWASKTWQSIIERGDTVYGKRSVEAYLKRPAFELYDLVNDPDEIQNLADNPEFAETLERMKVKLRDFQKETGDPWIVKWQHE